MLTSVRRFFSALLLFWAFAAGAGHAQEEEDPLPPPPESRVLDSARLFAREPDRLAIITDTLAALETKHGVRIYFAIYDSIMSSNAADRARRLQKEWLGEQPGLVLVLESDSRTYRFGQAPPEQEEVEPGNRVQRWGATDLAPFELAALVEELKEPLLASKDSQEFAETLGIGVARGVSTILDERAAAPAGGTKVRMVVLAIGVISVTGLLALLVVAGLKRAEAKSRERFAFPKVGVGIRLGAPYGGGKVVSRNFRRSAKPLLR